jgi:hypothetical protein
MSPLLTLPVITEEVGMKVVDYKENEDGSANVELEMTEEEKSYLIEVGFIQLLKNAIEHGYFGHQCEQKSHIVPDPTTEGI